MTVSEAMARGRGTLGFWLAIDAVPKVLATVNHEPTDDWYTDGHHTGVLVALRRNDLRYSCRARPAEVWPTTSGPTLVLDDKSLELTAMCRSTDALGSGRLTATLSKTATTIQIDSAAGFASSGVVWVDQEAIHYSGKTSNTLTGCTRGYYGSQAVAHTVDTSAFPPCEPEVFDAVPGLDGRRVVLYGAERRNGVWSETEQLWVGYITSAPSVRPYEVTLRTAHMLELFSRGMAFGEAAKGHMRGLYVPNFRGVEWGRLRLYDSVNGASTADIVAYGTADLFESFDDFFEAAETAVSAVSGWHLDRLADGTILLWGENGGEQVAPEGGLAWQLLGFDLPDIGAIWVHGSEAQSSLPPAEAFACLRDPRRAFRPRLYLRSGEASRFVAAGVTLIDGETEYGTRLVDDVVTGSDYLELAPAAETSGATWPDAIIARLGAPVPTVAQVWTFDGELADCVRMLWSGDVYTGSASIGYTVSREWLPGPALRDEDVDWNTLRELCRLLPYPLGKARVRIAEPVDVSKVLTGLLLVAGIVPFVGNDGTVQWMRVRVPSLGEASTSVGPSLVDGNEAVTGTTVEPASEQPVNAIHLVVADGFRWLDEDNARDVYLVDRESLQRYGQKLAFDPLDPVGSIDKAARKHPWYGPTEVPIATLVETMGSHVRQAVGALLRKPRPILSLPVTPGASLVSIGDVLAVTTHWGVDPLEGTPGLTAKLALAVGWQRSHATGTVSDRLEAFLIDEGLGNIAPCALATSWDGGAKTLTCADVHLHHGPSDDTDLDHFAAGHAVRCEEYDSEAPATFKATIESVDPEAGTIALASDPFGGNFPASGVWVTFDEYVECVEDQTGGPWVWLADDADGLIQDLATGHDWAP